MAASKVNNPEAVPKSGPMEKQIGESAEAFEAFQTYLRLGTSRSLVKVAEELGKSRQLIERWSSRWHWTARLEEYADRPSSSRGRALIDDAHARERICAHAKILQTRSAQKIARMTNADVDRLTPMECARLFFVAANLELKLRQAAEKEVKKRNRGLHDPTPVPRIIFNWPRTTEGMVAVRLADGAAGFIPEECIKEFLEDYPDAKIVQEGF